MQLDVQLAVLSGRAYERKSGRAGKHNELEYLEDVVQGNPVIAIRGTEAKKAFEAMNWLDIVRDIRIIPLRDKRIGWAHAGMLKGAKSLYEAVGGRAGIITRLSEAPSLYPRLIVTGHSLGAGVGYLFARYVHARLNCFGVNVEFVGFGTPNIMVSNPAVPFDARFYRNGDDIITELLGHCIYKPFPQIQVGDSSGVEPIDDHDIKEYIKAVEAYVGN